MISFFNGLKTYGKKNQLKNTNALVIFLSILSGERSCNAPFFRENIIYFKKKASFVFKTKRKC